MSDRSHIQSYGKLYVLWAFGVILSILSLFVIWFFYFKDTHKIRPDEFERIPFDIESQFSEYEYQNETWPLAPPFIDVQLSNGIWLQTLIDLNLFKLEKFNVPCIFPAAYFTIPYNIVSFKNGTTLINPEIISTFGNKKIVKVVSLDGTTYRVKAMKPTISLKHNAGQGLIKSEEYSFCLQSYY